MTQDEALAILKTGANVFLTGEPGSGKTHTVNTYTSYVRSCGIEPAITASTGIAATHIGGFTIHSWSGIGVRNDLSKYDLDHLIQNKNVVRRIGKARILIIDEVSMLSARTLSMVDAVCRELRGNAQPFGGLQVILVGDFFQLPPIAKRENGESEKKGEETLERFKRADQPKEFAFSSPAWNNLSPLVCYLSEQHRHEDPAFLEFLSAIRDKGVVESHRELLRKRYSPKPKDGITQLYSRNANVDEINGKELAKLVGGAREFLMESRGPEKLVEALKRGCLSPETLSLKIGARVMFTKNDTTLRRYVNGTLGTVAGFSGGTGDPIVKTNAGKTIVAEPDEWRIEDGMRTLARITQVPLRLAWALTVHKSQGMSLDAAHMDLSDTFEYGQGYVALSRLRGFSGLSLAGLNERALEVHPDIRAKDGEFRNASRETREAFAKIPSGEILKMHGNFIRACGGEPGKNAKSAKTYAPNSKELSTYEVTKEFVLAKLPLKEIAKRRGITVGTIISHLETLSAEKKIVPTRDLAHIERDPERFEEMKKALLAVYQKEKKLLLSPARAALGDAYGYDELRLARLFIEV